jgi:flagellar hook-associated protein 2
MAGIALSGLASGVDTSTIVTQLMQLERQGQTRTQYRQANINQQATDLKALKTKLETLKSAATALRDVATWKEGQTVESSASASVVATRTGGAPIGGYSVQVTQLAASAQNGYTWTESASAATLTLDDTDSTTDPVDVAIPANAKIADVASAINSKSGSPVFAAVVGDKLILSTRKTGEAAGFSASGTGLSAPDPTLTKPGKDAKYLLEGDTTPRSSASNVVADALPGLTLTFKGVTASSATVTVGAPALDTGAVKTKVKAFVDAYNAVVALGRDDVAEKKVSDPSSTFEAQQGALYGDTGVTSWLSKLRLQVGKQYSGIGNAATMDGLADLGITSGKVGSSTAQAKSGTLELDETKLADALTNDPQAVRRLLGGAGTSALAQDVEKLTGDLGDVIDSRVASIDKQSRRITDDLARAETRLADREKRLKAQFAAMETALSNAQSTQSQLTSQLSSLS